MSAFDNVYESPHSCVEKTNYFRMVKRSPWLCGLCTLAVVALALFLMKPTFVKDDDNEVLYSRIIIYSMIAGIIISVIHHKFY